MTPAPQHDTLELKELAAAASAEEDTSTTQDVEDRDARQREQHNSTKRVETAKDARYSEFAAILGEAMNRAGLTPSQLARLAWGSTTDKRGYSVAKNRDRLSHYLTGGQFPEPENLERLASALGIPVEDLAQFGPTPPPQRSQRSQRSQQSQRSQRSPGNPGDVLLTTHLPDKSKMRIQMDKVLD